KGVELRSRAGPQQDRCPRARPEVESTHQSVRMCVTCREGSEGPVLLNELEGAGVVQNGVADQALAGISANQQCGDAVTESLPDYGGGAHPVVPATRPVVRPHKRR